MAMTPPRLALTMGDVAGIGPEILVRALTTGRLTDFCQPLVIGHPVILERTARLLNLPLDVEVVAEWGGDDDRMHRGSRRPRDCRDGPARTPRPGVAAPRRPRPQRDLMIVGGEGIFYKGVADT